MSVLKLSQRSNIELEERRQQALVVAQECMAILKDKFGATEVMLCGSLAGESPWHWHSDIDIAVRGMSKDAVWDAYSVLEDIIPHWLKVDVIPLEFAPKYLVERILKIVPMPENKYLALKSRIEDEMKSIEDTISTIEKVFEQMEGVADIIVAPALASYVADFYNGCERISERVAVYLDGGLPTGKDWHYELLKQLAEPGGNNRPPLWSGSLLLELDEYRKFRHLERHIYKIELKPEKVIILAENVKPVFNKIKSSIHIFFSWKDRG
jgi:predicted nucleotidyltransferase